MGMPTNAVKPFDANREYTGGQYQSTQRFAMRQGDPRIHDLFVEYTNFPQRSTYWDFRKRVILAALEMFAGDYNWFVRQDSNSMITGQNYAFLVDTVRFIATGHRRISIYTWPELLSYNPPSGRDSVDSRRDITNLFNELSVEPGLNAIIQKWVSHKGGFDDLMYTLHMLFGTVPEKVH